MSIVISSGEQWVQGASYIGYSNLLLDAIASVSASAEDVEFPALNASTWTSHDKWKVSAGGVDIQYVVTLTAARNVNSYGLFKHNLADVGVTVKLQSSTDGSTWVDVTGSTRTPITNDTLFFVGALTSAGWHRLVFENLPASGSTLEVGNIFIGESLQLFSPPETGFTPMSVALNGKYNTNIADGGDFLGRSLIRKGARTRINMSGVDEGWVDTNWKPFMVHAEKQPFYYAWDTVGHSTDVGFCFTDGRRISQPKFTTARRMSVPLSFNSL